MPTSLYAGEVSFTDAPPPVLSGHSPENKGPPPLSFGSDFLTLLAALLILEAFNPAHTNLVEQKQRQGNRGRWLWHLFWTGVSSCFLWCTQGLLVLHWYSRFPKSQVPMYCYLWVNWSAVIIIYFNLHRTTIWKKNCLVGRNGDIDLCLIKVKMEVHLYISHFLLLEEKNKQQKHFSLSDSVRA